MVFSVTYNTISGTLWRSILLVEETGITGKTTHLPHFFDKLYYFLVLAKILLHFKS
jgi:hypothetical protein